MGKKACGNNKFPVQKGLEKEDGLTAWV